MSTITENRLGAASYENLMRPPTNGNGHVRKEARGDVSSLELDDVDAACMEAGLQALEDVKKSTVEPIRPKFPVRVRTMEDEEGRTEASNAARLVDWFRHDLRYVREWGEWIIWDAHRWRRDCGGISVQEMAAEVVNDLWRQIADMARKTRYYQEGEMIKFATKSNTVKGIAAAVSLARAKLVIAVGKLDRDPFLLNCDNGTLNLKTGRLHEPAPKDFITKLCPTRYDPEATCPVWLRFLSEVFDGNTELIAYLQRLLGYGITGDVREQVLPIFWGGGSNGKTTLVNAVMHVIGGDYAGAPPRELFSTSRFPQHPTQLMTLHGKRLTAAQETDAGAQLNEALIKHLTGGDAVTARGMYENFISFDPTHKLLLSTNYKPRVLGTDHAVWRRLKLIEFKVRFDGKRIDRTLPDKLRAEVPGILAWIVRGCMEWQRRGLCEPACVLLATENYRTDQDEVGRFIKECCEVGDGFEQGATELLQALKRWQPDSETTATALGRELGRLGFVSGTMTKGPNPGRKVWKGLRLARGEMVPVEVPLVGTVVMVPRSFLEPLLKA